MEEEPEQCIVRRADGYMSREDEVHVRVLVACDDTPTEYEATPTVALRNVAITRWCVDSGANRDICNERHLFNGNMTEKHIRIGEAGAGHPSPPRLKVPSHYVYEARCCPCSSVLFMLTV